MEWPDGIYRIRCGEKEFVGTLTECYFESLGWPPDRKRAVRAVEAELLDRFDGGFDNL